MRVLIINTSERLGGAAVAASRLMESLKNNGIKAKMLVRDKQTDQISVVGLQRNWWQVWRFVWERIVIWKANRFKKNNLFAVDIANTGTDITSLPEFQQADVIHLHWVNQGMLSLNDIRKILKSGKPVVWTMHDMWPCTGICHHARECTNYHQECNHCPYLYGGGSKKDLSNRIFRKKQQLYKEAPITFVTCSQWLKGQAEKSALLTGETVISIPNPINTNLFKPRNKKEARSKCHLPQNGKLILFGSAKINSYFSSCCFVNSKPIIVFILPTVKLFCSRFKNFVQINKMERIIMNTIDKIIQLLSEKKRTQKELTDSLGIEKSVFSAWKSGNSQSYKKYLPEIANFLDVSVGYLLGQEEKLDNVYLSLAKQAQDEGIDPDDIRLAIETIKAMKNK